MMDVQRVDHLRMVLVSLKRAVLGVLVIALNHVTAV